MAEKKTPKKTGGRTSPAKAGKGSASRGKTATGGSPRRAAAKRVRKDAAGEDKAVGGTTAPAPAAVEPSRSVLLRGIHDLRPAPGATKGRKRVGRGPGSGHGKTAGRGSKGQKSRSGYRHQRGFEGGQMPLHRRLPKRGFTNIFRIEYDVVNLSALDVFDAGASITPKELAARRLAREKRPIKILGDGKLSKALTVSAHKFSASARAGIEAAGGRCEVIAR